jgi:hypothetical protein
MARLVIDKIMRLPPREDFKSKNSGNKNDPKAVFYLIRD